MKRFLTRLFLGANLCTILFLWLCVLSTMMQPGSHPRLSLMGLAFPVFLVVNMAFILFWLIFKVRYTWVPVLGVLLCGGYCLDYCPMHFAAGPEDSTLCVVSYNVGGMKEEEQREELRRFIRDTAPDILCLQEVSPNWATWRENEQVLDSMGYHVMQSGRQTILSRFDILGDSVQVRYETRGNGSLACWLRVEGDSMLVIDNHLESDQLSDSDKTEYKEMIKDPGRERMETGGRLLVDKLSQAARYRGAQTDTICAMLRRYADHERLVCGDFNDTPISYTYQRINRLLGSAYRQSGCGLGVSFNQKGFYVRIDHIFVSDGWESVYTHVDSRIGASDHYPIIAYLRKKAK